MKKYHQRPIFGVRSGTSSWKPYVAEIRVEKSPIIRSDIPRSPAMLARKMATCFATKRGVDGEL
jgi:hypothetical protein